MKKGIKYITPEIIVTRLGAEIILAGASRQNYTTPELSDAKENGVVEVEETLPTQPNLWNDDEE
jgi:hypothetical protein